jgi:hypothetical protein
MNRKIRFLAMVFFALFLFACHRGGHDEIVVGPYTPAISSPIKIRVADVWNDTHQVFDVDVIGLLWSGLDDSLKKRGMLWSQEMGGRYYTLEAHVVDYKKGSAPARLLPWVGDTLLTVQCSLKDGDKQLASIESKRKLSFGNGTLTRGAWRKVFAEVSEDVIAQAVRKF